MKKFFVKYTYTDDYGRRPDYSYCDWFETVEAANNFVEHQQKINGSYFYLYKIDEGNYNDYLRMNELWKEYCELRKNF